MPVFSLRIPLGLGKPSFKKMTFVIFFAPWKFWCDLKTKFQNPIIISQVNDGLQK